MYFPIGWPKVLKLPEIWTTNIIQVVCNLDKILFAVLTEDSVGIWFCKPCVPIVFHHRSVESLSKLGTNILAEWKPDSSMIVIATSEGHLLFLNVHVAADTRSLYVQTDSPQASLRRDSAELFVKETIPPLHLSVAHEVMVWDGSITSIVCITMTEIMVSTTKGHILRYRWDGTQNRDYCLDLRRIPFCINKQVSKAEPISEDNTYVNDMEYSPLVGGFAVTFNNGKAAFVTASSLRFDPNQVQGIWAQGIEDATCASVNHKFRLIVFGRKNSQCVVYTVDETTGGLELSHECALSGRDYPGSPGEVTAQCWTPDGCTMAVTWARGGLALWSTFGALLVCSLGWDYGLNVDLTTANPLQLISMDWASEGYQLWMIRKETEETNRQLIELDFVKSAITVNPCMTQQSHLYLQGDDRLYVNLGDTLTGSGPGRRTGNANDVLSEQGNTNGHGAESRQWLVISIPETYSATNWPIKYTALDLEGQHLAIAGRTGLAHYSLQTRKWRLFGNESQERDFIVTGGLLWWRDYAIMGAYSVLDNADQLRFYPRECKLDNRFAKIVSMPAQVLLINIMQDQLITFCSDAQISVYKIEQIDAAGRLDLTKLQAVDVSALCVHSACVVSVALSTLRAEQGGTSSVRSIVLNVSGRLLMVPCEQVVHSPSNGLLFTCGQATVLASGVEMVWAPGNRTGGSSGHKLHLTEALWLACGASGMRVWLPLFPKRTAPQPQHAFISKRIMLPFQLNIYPLAILFENAIILGAENDTVLYSSDTNSPFSLPFCVLEKTSQVYLHQILRQLIRRNLGYHAWEIARSCTNLPYFPHSLELLLHEVLEEEATSKEPIPDAQMPSVVEFISEFPVYLQTVVQCARKTEIALWPCLFSAAGKPKHLFQQCLDIGQLETAASYLIILQNLEPSSVSRQHATLLLDTALEQGRWSLARDLVRFLRAIGPSDGDLPPKSPLQLTQQTQSPVSPNAEDLSLVPGVGRGRSYSTTLPPKDLKQEKGEHGKDFRESRRDSKVEQRKHSKSECQKSVENHMEVKRKKSAPVSINKSDSGDTPSTAEHFYIDLLVQRHARRLLSNRRLPELGRLAAHLDFHLVTWLGRERDRAARVDDAVAALKKLHEDFTWPYPMSVMGQSQEQVEIDQEEHEARKLGCTEDQLKSLRIDTSSSRVGDSGYTSLPRGSAVTVLASGPCDEAVTAASVASAVWPDEVDSLTWPPGPLPPPIGILEHSVAERGSPKSEVQLRYLLQLFMEASCLEWALIVSVLLRDAMAVLRIVNAARAPELTADTVKRLTDALHCLLYWTHHECFGYKPFMSTIQSQSPVLLRILCSKQLIQQQSISIEESDRPASTTPVGRSRTASTSSASASEVTAVTVGVVSTVSAFTGSTPHSPRSDDTYQCVVS